MIVRNLFVINCRHFFGVINFNWLFFPRLCRLNLRNCSICSSIFHISFHRINRALCAAILLRFYCKTHTIVRFNFTIYNFFCFCTQLIIYFIHISHIVINFHQIINLCFGRCTNQIIHAIMVVEFHVNILFHFKSCRNFIKCFRIFLFR